MFEVFVIVFQRRICNDQFFCDFDFDACFSLLNCLTTDSNHDFDSIINFSIDFTSRFDLCTSFRIFFDDLNFR